MRRVQPHLRRARSGGLPLRLGARRRGHLQRGRGRGARILPSRVLPRLPGRLPRGRDLPGPQPEAHDRRAGARGRGLPAVPHPRDARRREPGADGEAARPRGPLRLRGAGRAARGRGERLPLTHRVPGAWEGHRRPGSDAGRPGRSLRDRLHLGLDRRAQGGAALPARDDPERPAVLEVLVRSPA